MRCYVTWKHPSTAKPGCPWKLLFARLIWTGFPSSAADCLDQPLDFDDLLIAHQAATFAVRIAGYSMESIGLYAGDITVGDRAEPDSDGKNILSIFDDQFTIKRHRHCEAQPSSKQPNARLSAMRRRAFIA